jgi:hypothetical protein
VQQQQTELQKLQTELQQLRTENNQLKQAVGWVHRTYTWDVTGYTVPSNMLSPEFNVGGFKFNLDLDSMQPKGDRKDFTGLYLRMTKGWKALVKYEFQIISANDSSVSTSNSNEYTYERLKGRGPTKILSNETMKTYLEDGKVTVRARAALNCRTIWSRHSF